MFKWWSHQKLWYLITLITYRNYINWLLCVGLVHRLTTNIYLRSFSITIKTMSLRASSLLHRYWLNPYTDAYKYVVKQSRASVPSNTITSAITTMVFIPTYMNSVWGWRCLAVLMHRGSNGKQSPVPPPPPPPPPLHDKRMCVCLCFVRAWSSMYACVN